MIESVRGRIRRWGGGAACVLAVVALFMSDTARTRTLDRGDGIETQDWFRNDPFLVLPEGLAQAGADGRLLAIVWEQPGCPSCIELHHIHFAHPAIETYLRRNFDVMVMNRIGEVDVTALDGRTLREKKLAARLGISFTPTTVLYDRAGAEVLRLPGLVEPAIFLGAFMYARERDAAPAPAPGPAGQTGFSAWFAGHKAAIEDALRHTDASPGQ